MTVAIERFVNRRAADVALGIDRLLPLRCSGFFLESASLSAEPEAEIPMFCVASGVSANFAMVPKFEESARKSPREC